MRPFLLLVPLALSAVLALPVQAQSFGPRSITIEGHGETRASPDTAFIMSGVTTQGATAREALDANSAAMTELIATLKTAGIEARDIQTSGFSVSPNYVYTDARDANGYTLPPKINGYIVYNNVTVVVRALDRLGSVLDTAVSVGANTINGISFSVADPSKLYDEARRLAFIDARAKARLYADVAGFDLEAIRSISEGQNYGQPQPMMMREMAMSAGAGAVPIETGELTFAVNVTVTWGID